MDSTILKGYGGEAAPPVVSVTTPPKSPPEQPVGQLPFTGSELGTLLIFGVVLLVVGLGLRYSARKGA